MVVGAGGAGRALAFGAADRGATVRTALSCKGCLARADRAVLSTVAAAHGL